MSRGPRLNALVYQTFVVIDIKNTVIGMFNCEQLCDFFGVGFTVLLKYISAHNRTQKPKRYNMFYYIYELKYYLHQFAGSRVVITLQSKMNNEI